jgi:phosphate-selective porin OprO/OprP
MILKMFHIEPKSKPKWFYLAVGCLAISSTPSFADNTETTIKGEGIQFKQGNVLFKIGGRIEFDHDHFNGVHKTDEVGRGTEVRRGRLYVKGTLNKEWEGKLQIEVNDKTQDALFQDIYVKYKGWKGVDLTIGKAKEPFGLEVLQSSRYLTFVERAMISDAFGPLRSYGLKLFGQRDKVTVASGIYTEEQDEGHPETYAWSNRVTFTPVLTDDTIVHFGLAGSYRDWGGNNYKIKKTAEVHLADKIVKSRITAADHVILLGAEAAVTLGPFSFQTEYMRADVDATSDSGIQDANYDGYYVQASYFLTGEMYSYKKGIFGTFKQLSAQNVWQLTSRFSHIDVRDYQTGVEADNITLGVNYYPNSQIHFFLNYLMTNVTGAVQKEEENGQAVSLSFLYIF